ncbi:MAG: GTPase [Oscillospiraceae bacterium]|nr:GTPase [Oscillospiraceae bacterium]
MADKRNVPVFVVNGFLDGGKTTFVKTALIGDPKMEKERVLIICCEEGENEYEDLPGNIHVHIVEEKEELIGDVLFRLDEKFNPTYVIIEYNGMWGMQQLYSTPKPDSWRLVDQITVIDSTTLESYFANMKSIFADMLRSSTTVFVNRCTREDDFRMYKDNIKRCAPRAELMYLSDEEGIMDITLEEDLPYSLNDKVIKLDGDSFVVWYIDMNDNIDRYIGKVVEYSAQVVRPGYLRKGLFFAGNMVMTCCEDDMQFLGFLCKNDSATGISEGDYVRVRAEVAYEFVPEYGEEAPVLYAKRVTPVANPKKKKG